MNNEERTDGSALASFAEQVVVHPESQGLSGFVGEGLQRVPFGVGDSDSEDVRAGLSGAWRSPASRCHNQQSIRPRKSLTTGRLTGHNSPMTTTRTPAPIYTMTLTEIDAEIASFGVKPQTLGAVEQLQRLRATKEVA